MPRKTGLAHNPNGAKAACWALRSPCTAVQYLEGHLTNRHLSAL